MTQNHALGQAEVECLHPYQPGGVRLGVEQQHVQQVQEVLSGFIWREEWRGRTIISARVAWLMSKARRQRKPFVTLGFRRKLL